MTSSHVLNGNDRHVSPPTRALVQAAVEELHYRPNAIACSMVKQKKATVGPVLFYAIIKPVILILFVGCFVSRYSGLFSSLFCCL
ncbi:LacI family DNA-binding transcriptional regulator [Dictyobacter arantiisoli]|uniref:LacI family DNA-binding transcriptional regulator n=1 Tax=Dictyobacter arantiisoli TaxID=2014874 RepID=UPI0011EEC301